MSLQEPRAPTARGIGSVVGKLAAGRERDVDFADEALARGLADGAVGPPVSPITIETLDAMPIRGPNPGAGGLE